MTFLAYAVPTPDPADPRSAGRPEAVDARRTPLAMSHSRRVMPAQDRFRLPRIRSMTAHRAKRGASDFRTPRVGGQPGAGVCIWRERAKCPGHAQDIIV